jgi:predicted Zn finger-like uncharacterized protein
MIITCPNCKKKFKVDSTLIPEDGRDLKCGSCDHVWLYKVNDVSSEPSSLNENIDNNEFEAVSDKIKNDEIVENNQPVSIKITKKKEKKEKKENTGSKFFSYLALFIISFIALIILLDTLKKPLINIFPGLEIILFNLFEILKDIKLFIIDLY